MKIVDPRAFFDNQTFSMKYVAALLKLVGKQGAKITFEKTSFTISFDKELAEYHYCGNKMNNSAFKLVEGAFSSSVIEENALDGAVLVENMDTLDYETVILRLYIVNIKNEIVGCDYVLIEGIKGKEQKLAILLIQDVDYDSLYVENGTFDCDYKFFTVGSVK